jgi:hypothetical protein
MTFGRSLLLLGLACWPGVVGCGGAGHSVTGTAASDGAPLAGAQVALTDASGRVVATATVDENGTFRMSHVPEGNYGAALIPKSEELSHGPNGLPTRTPVPPLPFPKKYTSPATSGLKVDVGEGKPNELTIAAE